MMGKRQPPPAVYGTPGQTQHTFDNKAVHPDTDRGWGLVPVAVCNGLTATVKCNHCK